MGELFDIFNYALGIRALIASIMVGAMCGVLGCFIVLRNMSMIGDALSHAVLPGVVVGYVVAGSGVLAIFTGAVTAGFITAVLITWIQHNVKTKNDAAIGIVFTAMFSIGVMAISKISREGAHLDLDHFLFGNVLGLSNADLYLTGFITLYVIFSVFLFYRYLFATTFQPVIAETMGISVKTVHYFLMLLLSFAVVASMQAVGVILVVAMLITPASTAMLLTNRLKWMVVLSGIIGVISAVIGLIVTDFYNTTPGPAMAVVVTLFYLLAVFFAPQKGLLFKYFHRRKVKHKIQLEDTLKQSLKLHERGNLSLTNLYQRLGFSEPLVRKNVSILERKGLLKRKNKELLLTEQGEKEANKLVRAHRLWETYLVRQVGLNAGQIHEDAEKYEHILTDELLDELEASLDYPKQDPHGSPIPQKDNRPSFPLSNLSPEDRARIANHQLNEHLVYRLWKLGLLPKSEFYLLKKEEKNLQIVLDDEGQVITIPTSLAERVNVEKLVDTYDE